MAEQDTSGQRWIARIQGSLDGLAAGDPAQRARAAATVLEFAAWAWAETAAADVPTVFDQRVLRVFVAASPRGPVALCPADEPIDLVEQAAVDASRLGPEQEVRGELHMVRPHPDIDKRWWFEPNDRADVVWRVRPVLLDRS